MKHIPDSLCLDVFLSALNFERSYHLSGVQHAENEYDCNFHLNALEALDELRKTYNSLISGLYSRDGESYDS